MLVKELSKYSGGCAVADMCDNISHDSMISLIRNTSWERLAEFVSMLPVEDTPKSFPENAN